MDSDLHNLTGVDSDLCNLNLEHNTDSQRSKSKKRF